MAIFLTLLMDTFIAQITCILKTRKKVVLEWEEWFACAVVECSVCASGRHRITSQKGGHGLKAGRNVQRLGEKRHTGAVVTGMHICGS